MKTKTTTTRRKSALKLPKLGAFKRLTIRSRAKLFLAWVSNKRGPYKFFDNHGCPLSLFGKAITGKPAWGGSHGFVSGRTVDANARMAASSNGDQDGHVSVTPSAFHVSGSNSYSQLTTRLKAHLKAKS